MTKRDIVGTMLAAAGMVAAPALADERAAASSAAKDRPETSPTTAAAKALEDGAKAWGFRWNDLAFVPSPKLAGETRKAWSWLVPGHWRPILCTAVGGIFFETEAGTVRWLDIGAGTVEEVAPSVEAFETILRSGAGNFEWWFLPALVGELHRAGKRPGPGQAYFFLILPVFAEGKFTADNMAVISSREQLLSAADIHRQIARVPDGAKVELVPRGHKGKRRPGG
jgi:hypothetical protein